MYYSLQFVNSSNKNKTAWKIIRINKITKEKINPITLKIGQLVITNVPQIANEFNNYFISIAKNTLKEIEYIKSNKILDNNGINYLNHKNTATTKTMFLEPTCEKSYKL